MLSASDIVIDGPIHTGGGSLQGVRGGSGLPGSTARANGEVLTDRGGVIDTRLLDPNDPGAAPWASAEDPGWSFEPEPAPGGSSGRLGGLADLLRQAQSGCLPLR